MKIGFIGAGKWGQALFQTFSEHNSCLISSRTPRNIANFVSLEEVLQCEYLVFTIATQSVSAWLKENFTYSGQKVLVASKGIEASTTKFLDEIFNEYVPKDKLAYLSGPSFASEVMKKLPCAVVVSSCNMELAEEFSHLTPTYMKAYTDEDVIGAEISGAYKNVLAISCGVCEGLDLGNNARASLMARGLVEMRRFGTYFGANDETFLGLSGAGDLFLTASSPLSRNYRVGLMLAKQMTLDEILKELGEVAEGVLTSKAICKIAAQKDIYVPIANEVSLIIDGKNPFESMKKLMKQSWE